MRRGLLLMTSLGLLSAVIGCSSCMHGVCDCAATPLDGAAGGCGGCGGCGGAAPGGAIAPVPATGAPGLPGLPPESIKGMPQVTEQPRPQAMPTGKLKRYGD
jgi:hypothetical protein